uniref:Uncharacterized protein n=1 Tax=Oryza rufipogon TaxID=4529 RepID=A0A0E0MU12_ORYRU
MAVWAEITLKPWGQHGELGTGKTRVEVDATSAKRSSCTSRYSKSRVTEATAVDVERGETRQRSRPRVARQHGTMGEFEVKTGHDDSGD